MALLAIIRILKIEKTPCEQVCSRGVLAIKRVYTKKTPVQAVLKIFFFQVLTCMTNCAIIIEDLIKALHGA